MHFENIRMHSEKILVHFDCMQMFSESIPLHFAIIHESMCMHFKSVRMQFEGIRIYFETKQIHFEHIRILIVQCNTYHIGQPWRSIHMTSLFISFPLSPAEHSL